MLRIHFASEDIGRVRFAAAPVPAWEMLLSLHALRGRADHGVFGPWRDRTRRMLDPSAGLLLRLAPPRGYSPDFLTPAADHDIDSLVDTVQGTARGRLRADLGLLAAQGGPAGWMRPLADGDTTALRRVGNAMFRYYQRALSPVWDLIQTVVTAERAARVADLIDGGVERMLSRLHPQIRWEPPVLSVAYPVRRELRLGGRGLLLVPSYFCWARPIALHDSGLDPVLVYPANRGLQRLVPASDTADSGSLAQLLGATRAAVLQEIGSAEGVTGRDLVRRLRISPASVSEHASVLRRAGFVASHRTANTVWHMPTPLGRTVLEGGAGGRAQRA
ncbi:helix-turn-helix domain-containing protein [Streptomyces spinosirectus]|jgi:DNA-binding transcriptional ArsR family regulator|uniref:winged helix-turn-helix domain-containing protein n=1 Tax=Streptomyces TaxID=1883 RepID=UPI000D3849E2|nr:MULTISPECIES: helix-turn-helix domain-containing protein [Streptomyces]MBY8343987.1 winged helix-turn-helix transcriptional regulator [Streptomyces plumbidurans]PTM92924.1 helix-turn-helix protein [Streptomyces sp. VMFN-G11Ma]UIR15612.1 helix-turn-helix domain-containing protein [Streptomyces spinosirectus]